MRAHQPRCLVIDPLSALSTKLAHLASADAAQQFLDFLKGEGITVVNTSLMDGLSTDEATATGISTIADTWIHLSYVVQDGERNRALTIVKSRGTGHSNQVRELTLSDEGVTLTDVFVAQGKVLMGVARWEWEQEERAAQKRTKVAAELKRLQLQLAQAEAAARLQVVQTEMEARSAEIAVLARRHRVGHALLKTDQAVLRKMRHGDAEPPRPRIGGQSCRPQTQWPCARPTSMAPAPTHPARLRLRLYVAGNAPNSVRAIANAKAICDEHLPRGTSSKSSICSRTAARAGRRHHRHADAPQAPAVAGSANGRQPQRHEPGAPGAAEDDPHRRAARSRNSTQRLAEAEATIAALLSGQIDAVVDAENPHAGAARQSAGGAAPRARPGAALPRHPGRHPAGSRTRWADYARQPLRVLDPRMDGGRVDRAAIGSKRASPCAYAASTKAKLQTSSPAIHGAREPDPHQVGR